MKINSIHTGNVVVYFLLYQKKIYFWIIIILIVNFIAFKEFFILLKFVYFYEAFKNNKNKIFLHIKQIQTLRKIKKMNE